MPITYIFETPAGGTIETDENGTVIRRDVSTHIDEFLYIEAERLDLPEFEKWATRERVHTEFFEVDGAPTQAIPAELVGLWSAEGYDAADEDEREEWLSQFRRLVS